MQPGGYHPKWCELFTHICELMYLWALCCLVDKRGAHLASSSWLAYVKHGRIFFPLFVVAQVVSTSAGTERMELRWSVKHHSYTETHTDCTYQWLPPFCDWFVFSKQNLICCFTSQTAGLWTKGSTRVLESWASWYSFTTLFTIIFNWISWLLQATHISFISYICTTFSLFKGLANSCLPVYCNLEAVWTGIDTIKWTDLGAVASVLIFACHVRLHY